MRHLLIAAAIALGAAVTPAAASESFGGAAALDKVEASYARHTREHRHWEIQRNMERQQRHERRHRYRDDYGYRHHRGGPPPWAHGRRDHRRYDRF
jgi:Ni/Co efflux regulator RcnB